VEPSVKEAVALSCAGSNQEQQTSCKQGEFCCVPNGHLYRSGVRDQLSFRCSLSSGPLFNSEAAKIFYFFQCLFMVA
jgi:hypothetical protein